MFQHHTEVKMVHEGAMDLQCGWGQNHSVIYNPTAGFSNLSCQTGISVEI